MYRVSPAANRPRNPRNAAARSPDRRGHGRGVAAVACASAGSLPAGLSSPASRRPCAAACTVDMAVAGLLGYRREEESSRHTGPANGLALNNHPWAEQVELDF